MKRWLSRFRLKSDVWVYVPTNDALKYGQRIAGALLAKWPAPDYYYHLLPGGHVEALRSHASSKFFIKADVHRFFNSINRSRITRVLKRFYSYKEAREIACLSTVPIFNDGGKKYVLPFGFSQSQILSSICFRESKLGGYLNSLVDLGLVISVYVDDIIISGEDEQELNEILNKLQACAESSGFRLNAEKTVGPAEFVTAFNIFLDRGVLRISEGRMNAFKLALMAADSEAQVKGILGYVASVNEHQLVELQ